jgi:mono/diheme cytochrome c family protein
MDPKGAGSELQETRGAAPLLRGLMVVLALAGAALAPARRAVADAPGPAHPVDYTRDVAPLLTRWCVSCHGADEAEANLRLDSLGGLMRGGDAGPVVIPNDPDASLLVAKIERRHRPSMPPRRKLPPSAIALIRTWIAAGAPR